MLTNQSYSPCGTRGPRPVTGPLAITAEEEGNTLLLSFKEQGFNLAHCWSISELPTFPHQLKLWG
jgi:hypothetical protein